MAWELFLEAWDSTSVPPIRLNHPNSVFVDNGEVYVADAGASEVKVFDLNHTLLRTLGHRAPPPQTGQPPASPQPGEFINGSLGTGPGGVAVWGNRVYVTDLGGNLVHVFDRQHRTPSNIPRNPWPGGPNDPFNTPGRIAVYGGEVYVTDSRNHRVQVFDLDGNFLRLWGRGPGALDGEFNNPAGIAVSRKEVYVSDRSNHRVEVFTHCGVFLRKFEEGYFTGNDGPVGIALYPPQSPRGCLHRHGRVREAYVADISQNRVHVFHRGGRHLRHFPDHRTHTNS
jgi:DNA-binding beta-propeller fold protein YncE